MAKGQRREEGTTEEAIKGSEGVIKGTMKGAKGQLKGPRGSLSRSIQIGTKNLVTVLTISFTVIIKFYFFFIFYSSIRREPCASAATR